ncbi:MAG: hypothetical protein O9972_27970 [Burkholderiales bacterium]|nr:hypothetical protein [Burkholderiales bacterium]
MSNVTARSLKRTVAAAFAALAIAATLAATPAQAGNGRNAAFAAGAVGGLALGALAVGAMTAPAYGAPRAYYGEPAPRYRRACWTERQPIYDAWGDYAGTRRVRVCN